MTLNCVVVSVVYLCCTVSKLGQDFGSVVWDDAHGITGQVEFLQTGQRADVPDLLQLQTHTHTLFTRAMVGCFSSQYSFDLTCALESQQLRDERK